MEKYKVLWVSDLVTPTGFSRVAHSLINNLKPNFNITGVGINYRGDPHDLGIPVYPASTGGSLYGENRVVDILNAEEFDILFILNDAWVIDRLLKAIKKGVTKELPAIVVYFPVDAEEHDSEWYQDFDIVNRAVTYTKFGEQVVKTCVPNMKLDIIPHGADKATFYKKYNTKLEAKAYLFGEALNSIEHPEDSFIVLNANRNQPRKKLGTTLKGFQLFSKDKPSNVKIYMHCGIVDNSINVAKLAVRYKIDNRLIVSSSKRGVQVVPDSRLNDIYNACDVGINTSMGEGWGLTNMEHAMTHAAQLVPNHSACAEIFGDCGLLIPTHHETLFDLSMTLGKEVSPESVADGLQNLYDNKSYREELAQLAYAKFSRDEYDWAVISDTWKNLFFEVLDDHNSISK